MVEWWRNWKHKTNTSDINKKSPFRGFFFTIQQYQKEFDEKNHFLSYSYINIIKSYCKCLNIKKEPIKVLFIYQNSVLYFLFYRWTTYWLLNKTGIEPVTKKLIAETILFLLYYALTMSIICWGFKLKKYLPAIKFIKSFIAMNCELFWLE